MRLGGAGSAPLCGGLRLSTHSMSAPGSAEAAAQSEAGAEARGDAAELSTRIGSAMAADAPARAASSRAAFERATVGNLMVDAPHGKRRDSITRVGASSAAPQRGGEPGRGVSDPAGGR